MANIDFPSSPTAGQKYTFAGVTYTFTAQGVWSPSSSVSIASVPQGRLTYQSGVPVMTTNATGITSLFYTPYEGNKVPVYNGVNVGMRTFVELLATTPDFTKNPSPIAPNKVNDWFIWDDNNTLRLSHGPDWTNNTTRQDALIRMSGLLLNNVAITNACAAQRGTYVGTTMSNAAGQLDWIYGGIGGPPIGGFFGLWNMYNRAQVSSFLGDTVSQWTYGSTAARPMNGNATTRFTYVSGIAEDGFTAITVAVGNAATSGMAFTGVGYDQTTSFQGVSGTMPGLPNWMEATGRFTTASLGKHFMVALEACNTDANPVTFLGIYGLPSFVVGSMFSTITGMFFEGRM